MTGAADFRSLGLAGRDVRRAAWAADNNDTGEHQSDQDFSHVSSTPRRVPIRTATTSCLLTPDKAKGCGGPKATAAFQWGSSYFLL
jgi:hypothetical protein